MTAICISDHAVKRWRERSDKLKNRVGCTDETLRLELVSLFEKSRRARLSSSNYARNTRHKYGPNAEYYVTTRKSTKWLLVFGYGSYLVTVFKIQRCDDRFVDYVTGESINGRNTRKP